jgi:hypothetical protein
MNLIKVCVEISQWNSFVQLIYANRKRETASNFLMLLRLPGDPDIGPYSLTWCWLRNDILQGKMKNICVSKITRTFQKQVLSTPNLFSGVTFSLCSFTPTLYLVTHIPLKCVWSDLSECETSKCSTSLRNIFKNIIFWSHSQTITLGHFTLTLVHFGDWLLPFLLRSTS